MHVGTPLESLSHLRMTENSAVQREIWQFPWICQKQNDGVMISGNQNHRPLRAGFKVTPRYILFPGI